MKEFLRWLFQHKWKEYEDKLFWEGIERKEAYQKDLIATHALKQLGYEVVPNPKFVAKEYKADSIPDIDGTALPNSFYLIKKV